MSRIINKLSQWITRSNKYFSKFDLDRYISALFNIFRVPQRWNWFHLNSETSAIKIVWKSLSCPFFKDRRLRSNLIEMSRIMNNMENFEIISIFFVIDHLNLKIRLLQQMLSILKMMMMLSIKASIFLKISHFFLFFEIY